MANSRPFAFSLSLWRPAVSRAVISLVLLSLLASFSQVEAASTQYVEGEVIVTFKNTTSLPAATAALSRHSLKFERHFPQISARRGRQTGLVVEKKKTTAQLIADLKKDANVETVEPNYLRWVHRTPNDPRFFELWALQNTAQAVNGTVGTSGADIGFIAASSLSHSASQPVVAVIDTGVDYAHADLVANLWTNSGEIPYNGVDDDGNGYVDDYYGYDFVDGTADPGDSGEHGTHVAGTIAATGNNSIGVIGIDSQAKVMALKVSSDGDSISNSAEISALEYATMMKGRGVNIVAINASFGGGGNSSAESSAIQAAGNAGIIFCCAAGNDGTNNDTTAAYPANYRLSNMIVVAASTQSDALASFSNYGATKVDLAAPGTNILSAKPSTVTLQAGSTVYTTAPFEYARSTTGLTGTIYDCGIGSTGQFPAAVSGNIALIARGSLNFSTKVSNAMAAGAIGVIIYNNASGDINGTLGTGNWIPTRAISQSDGLALKAALPLTGTFITTANYQFLDGTSMATPHVSGAVAFAAMNFPSETVTQRIQRILTHVDVKSALQGKVATNGRLNLRRIVDTDSNSLPDWWEQTYFGVSTGVNPSSDWDGDGQTNLDEFLTGTSPISAQSSLRVSSITRTNSGTGFILTWPSVANKTYQVLYTDNPAGPWRSDLPNSQVTATGSQSSYLDSQISGVDKRFYRVEIVP